MKFGKQNRYCPNCGKHMYDEKVGVVSRIPGLMCNKECRDEWEMKETRSIMGKSAEETNEKTI